jgi:hypothetical protein
MCAGQSAFIHAVNYNYLVIFLPYGLTIPLADDAVPSNGLEKRNH